MAAGTNDATAGKPGNHEAEPEAPAPEDQPAEHEKPHQTCSDGRGAAARGGKRRSTPHGFTRSKNSF